MRKKKTYQVDEGYMTCPDATRLFLNIVGKEENEYQQYYSKFLKGAKQGRFGGREYKTNMYQVKKAEVEKYANSFQSQLEFDLQVPETSIPLSQNKSSLYTKSKEIKSIIEFEEQGILNKDAAYDAIKKLIFS